MTTFVKESAKTVDSGLTNMKIAMTNDYVTWITRCGGSELNDHTKRMIARYKDNYTVTYGKKYIKINGRGDSVKFSGCFHDVKAFVIGVDNDKKFKMGDILRPASWSCIQDGTGSKTLSLGSSPARNYVHGNILKGGYSINWAGPVFDALG